MKKELEKFILYLEFRTPTDQFERAITCSALSNGETLYCFAKPIWETVEIEPTYFTVSVSDTIENEYFPSTECFQGILVVPSSSRFNDSRIHTENFPDDLKPILAAEWQKDLCRLTHGCIYGH
jgi:hypothetical protein